jgi:N-acetylglucosamine-6-phosphate deacetylase
MTKEISGRAFIDGHVRDRVTIEIDGATIRDIRVGSGPERDTLLLPGFIDLHVHGGNGADFMDGSEEAAAAVAAFHARHGTTALAATTLTAPNKELKHALRGIVGASIRPSDKGAEIVGVHLEGPYVNAKYAGAQNREAIRHPMRSEVDGWLSICGNLPVVMTIAPEIEGAMELLDEFHGRLTFSIGHSAATYSQSVAAIESGAKHFTHLFNAMTPLHHREPGIIGAALVSPDTTFELIADGHHVHPAVLGSFAQLFHTRAILVTDAMRAAGMPAGSYKLFEHEVTVADGAARLADGTLAGSVLTMVDAVRNMIELAGVPIETVIPLATTHPAHRLGVATRKGKLAIGYDADIVALTPKFEIEQVWTRGVEVHG